MKVCEIFKSIQGESTYAGLPCIFVRLTGCNLRCSYYDTTYAYDEGSEMTTRKIIESVRDCGLNLVEITGGEPLLQPDVLPLISQLLDSGVKVLVETNGSVDIGDVDKRAAIIMDVKTPGSGMSDRLLMANFDLLKRIDEVKFVITDRSDYEWAGELVRQHRLSDKCSVLFSPAYRRLESADLSGWIIDDNLPVRLNLQLHKYIYSPYQRGV